MPTEFVFDIGTTLQADPAPDPFDPVTDISSLALTYANLKSDVGHHGGYNRTVASFTSAQAADVNAAINSGLRRFYGEHPWRFLRPTMTIELSEDATEVDLPMDFGGTSGDLTFTDQVGSSSIPIVGEQIIRRLRQTSMAGRPQCVAIRPKDRVGEDPQTWELMIYPTPDQDYDVEITYRIQAAALVTTDAEYPYGGMDHAETLRWACRAAFDSEILGQIGVAEARYQQELAKSVQKDSRMAAESLGFGVPGIEGQRVLADHRSTSNIVEVTAWSE